MLGFYNYTTWLTYFGALCGVVGTWCAAQASADAPGYITTAIVLLALAGLTDSFDGKVASTKKDRSEDMKKYGIQIDSLSDLISFGILPAAILAGLARMTFPDVSPLFFLPLGGAFVLAALIRLAFFNVSEETRQQEEGGVRKFYTGIPVTLVSIFIPIVYGFSELLRFIISGISGSDISDGWRKFYFAVYCLMLLFFGFGFLFKGFKIAKLRGKKMIVVISMGVVGVIGVIAAYFFNA